MKAVSKPNIPIMVTNTTGPMFWNESCNM